MFQRPLPWRARLKGSASDGPMVDDFEQPTQLRESPCGDAGGAAIEHVDRKPYAARLRMIILLSLLCWAVLLGVVALIIA